MHTIPRTLDKPQISGLKNYFRVSAFNERFLVDFQVKKQTFDEKYCFRYTIIPQNWVYSKKLALMRTSF